MYAARRLKFIEITLRIVPLPTNRFCRFCILLLLLGSTLFLSCRKGPQQQQTVYTNNFENADLSNISGAITSFYNQSTVLGRYNKGGFELKLKDLPRHDVIEVTFDLYIHDSWDGNGILPDGPDIWRFSMEGNTFINTTFSNKVCPFTCFPQSYPFNYLNSNQQPKNGALRTDLPGVCLWETDPNGTSSYSITRRMSHKSPAFSMRCVDELVQPNTADQLCDESWSVDNLVIKTILLD